MKKYFFPTLCTIIILAAFSFPGFTQSQKEMTFKDWNYSSNNVFGLIPMENKSHRKYYKITKIDNQSTKVQEYNPAGIVTNTTVIRFVNGKLNMLTRTDQWGDTYEISKFALSGVDQFTVTRLSSGKNDFLPCKAAKYIYKNNLLIEIRYLSYTNQLCNNANGVAIIKYKRYDDKNRFSLLKEMTFFDADNKPVISQNYDCHKVIYEYNERGNQLSVAYYGTDGEALTNRYGGYKNRYHYNENDEMISSEIIGLNDEPTNNAYGVAKTEYSYKNGWTIKQTRYDEKDNIAKSTSAGDGVAVIKYEYDDMGNETKRSYYDENNNPISNTSGYHTVAYQYSPAGMLISLKYLDKYDSPMNDNYGIHNYKYVKDGKGNTIQEAYFSKDNVPVKDEHDEVYMLKYKHDEYGREISRSFWQDSITKMVRWNGYHEQVNKYNAEGQVTEAIYLDDKGNSFVSKSGYSRLVNNFNSNARLAERKCFTGNTPAIVKESFVQDYHAIKYSYDNNGRVAFMEYFDTDGKPANANFDLDNGFTSHKIELVYKGSRVIQEKFYQANNDAPLKIIDCISHDYVTTNGINKGYKNQ